MIYQRFLASLQANNLDSERGPKEVSLGKRAGGVV